MVPMFMQNVKKPFAHVEGGTVEHESIHVLFLNQLTDRGRVA